MGKTDFFFHSSTKLLIGKCNIYNGLFKRIMISFHESEYRHLGISLFNSDFKMKCTYNFFVWESILFKNIVASFSCQASVGLPLMGGGIRSLDGGVQR